jgi:hypothetical protein
MDMGPTRVTADAARAASAAATGLPGPVWAATTHFVNRTDREAFVAVDARLEQALGEGPAVMLYDLDMTLYSNVLRQQQATEYLLASGIPIPRAIRAALAKVRVQENWYGLPDALAAVGASLASRELAPYAAAIRQIYDEGLKKNEIDPDDPPYPGAVDYVRDRHRLGASAVYMTARLAMISASGTERRLRRDGFPIGDKRTRLILKQDLGLTDREYKDGAHNLIEQMGPVVSTYENEPSNIVALARRFRNAKHVFIHTAASQTPAEVQGGIYQVRGWRDAPSLRGGFRGA